MSYLRVVASQKQEMDGFFHHLWWWLLYLFILQPIRFLFSVILPPVLFYVWHNGSFLHLAQDDRPVYEHIRLIGKNVSYGSLSRETFDLIIPDKTIRNLGDTGETWRDYFLAIGKTFLDFLTCYPRAIFAWLFPKSFGFQNDQVNLGMDYPAILFVHGGTSNLRLF